MTLPDILGTIPQWITAAGISTVIIAYWRRGVALRGLANTKEADIRDHYAEELVRNTGVVNDLREQLRTMESHYRDMLEQGDRRIAESERRIAESDRRHEECEKARQEMRDELDGLKNQMKAQSADRVLRLEENCTVPSPMVADAARRVKKIMEDGGK